MLPKTIRGGSGIYIQRAELAARITVFQRSAGGRGPHVRMQSPDIAQPLSEDGESY